jgi:hypothetical protein
MAHYHTLQITQAEKEKKRVFPNWPVIETPQISIRLKKFELVANREYRGTLPQ